MTTANKGMGQACDTLQKRGQCHIDPKNGMGHSAIPRSIHIPKFWVLAQLL